MPSELFDADKLIDWLRRQRPDEEYVWQDPVFCLMGRYVTEMGTAKDLYGYSVMPYYYQIAQTKPHTFGAALERAETLKALPPPVPQLTYERTNDGQDDRPREREAEHLPALP